MTKRVTTSIAQRGENVPLHNDEKGQLRHSHSEARAVHSPNPIVKGAQREVDSIGGEVEEEKEDARRGGL